jgi:hypothetical protein
VKHRDKSNLSCHVSEINGATITNGNGKMFQQGRILAHFRTEKTYYSEQVTVVMPDYISHVHYLAI